MGVFELSGEQGGEEVLRLRRQSIVLSAVVAVLASTALVPTTAFAAPGDLDPGFSRDGKVLSPRDFGSASAIEVAALDDGGWVVAGTRYPTEPGSPDPESGVFVTAYRQNGKLDRSFGSGGSVTGMFGQGAGARNVEVQSDGKIVVAASKYLGGSDFAPALARLSSDGSFDQSFGSAGTVVTEAIPGSSDRLGYSGDAVIDASGRIVLGGATAASGAFVARYLTDGTLDPAFSGDGIAVVAPDARATFRSVSVLPDGRLLAAGDAASLEVVLARYLPDGQLDTGFSDDGIATSPSPTFPGRSMRRSQLAGDGTVWIAGTSGTGGLKPSSFATLYRFSSDGALDNAFSQDGFAPVPDSFDAPFDLGLAVQPDGLPLVSTTTGSDFLVSRFALGGDLDLSFSHNGSVTTDFRRLDDFATGAALTPDGSELLVVGTARGKKGSQAAIAQYELFDGPPDADADGVRDKRDRCPREWGSKPNGCPQGDK